MHVLAPAAMYEQQQLVANVVAVCHPSGGRGQGDGGSMHVCIFARRQTERGTGVWSQNLDRSAADSRRRESKLHSQPDRQGDHSDRADHHGPSRRGGPHGQGLVSRPYGIVAGRVSRGALSTTAAEDRNVRRVLCAVSLRGPDDVATSRHDVCPLRQTLLNQAKVHTPCSSSGKQQVRVWDSVVG